MLSLVYVSSATQRFSQAGLVELLEKARGKNAKLDLTGILLHKDSNFLQVLEGPDDAVRTLFHRIGTDPRHRGTLKLLERPINEREFPDWSMAFHSLEDPSLREVAGYSELMNKPLTSSRFVEDPSQVGRLLSVFHRNLTRSPTGR